MFYLGQHPDLGEALYNEIDPACCAVLAEQIASGVIAPGRVESRSIKELTADDIAGFTQVHWFAGGGIWSVAARMAGWSDRRPIWTASCPCQGESLAGKRLGAADPRHLWPDLYRILRTSSDAGRRPPIIVGEQVAAAAGSHWLDRVASDLEDEGYAFRAVDFPACAVDAPHIRNRVYWSAIDALADAESLDGRRDLAQRGSEGRAADGWPDETGSVVNAPRIGRREGRPEYELERGRPAATGANASGVTLGDAFEPRLEGYAGHGDYRQKPGRLDTHAVRSTAPPNGSFWSGAEWLTCHDGKARRTQPGVRLLVDGLPGRVDLWRIAGNAIVPQAAAEVIKALMDVLDASP